MATKKQRRIQMLVFGGVLLAASTLLVSLAFRESIVLFVSPTELMAEPPRPDRVMRIGGLVAEGSVRRGEGQASTFAVTDGNTAVPVSFTGVLPDLFAEGQGTVVQGYFRDGRFEAIEVLAKHDENYMPKEVVDALKAQGVWEEGGKNGK